MLPMSVRVKTGRYADARTYHVQIVREPALLPTLIMAVLTNAIDTEGNLPEELTAQLNGDHPPEGSGADHAVGHLQRPAIHRPDGAGGAVQPAGVDRRISWSGTRWRRCGSSRSTATSQIEPGRKVAAIESVRLLSDTVEPGQELKGVVTLKPFKGERETIEIVAADPGRFPRRPLRGDLLRRGQQRPADGPQRPGAAGAARPGGAPPDAPGPDRAEADGGLPPRPRAGPRASRSRGRRCRTCRAASGRSSPRKREVPVAADPLGPGPGRADRLGRRGVADAPVHGGQGCGAVVIVVSMSRRRRQRAHRPRSMLCRAGPAPFEDNEDRNATARVCPAASAPWIVSLLVVGLAASLPSPDGLSVAPRRGPRSRPGGRRGRRRSPSATARAWSSPTTGGCGSGHAVAPVGSLTAARVWDLARTRDGSLLAATGDAGKVFRREPRPDGPWTVLYDADRLAGALAGRRPGRDDLRRHRSERPGRQPDRPEASGVSPRPEGPVHLGPGRRPAGQPLRGHRARPASSGSGRARADGRCSTTARRPTCSAWRSARTGSVYAGSDGEGLIYRVARDGKATVLFDAPQAEIRTLLAAADGTLYAGTAAEAGGSGGSRNSLFLTRGGLATGPRRRDESRAERSRPARTTREPRCGSRRPRPRRSARPAARPRPPGGGSAAPRPVTPGDNAVYRIDADGVPREVLRVKALIHALAWADDRLWVGTGPEGQLYEVRERGEETAPIAKLDNGQILSLLAEPGGGLLIGTGDPGGVLRLSAELRDGRAPGLRGPRHPADQPIRRAELAGPSSRPARRSRSRPAPGNVGRARRDLVGLVARADRPGRGQGRLAARPVRPVPGQARHHRPAADARAAVGRAELPDVQPRAGDHAARRARPERRRRHRPPDPAEPALGRDRPQRGRPQLHRLRPQGGLARLDSASTRSRSPRRPTPGTRRRFRPGCTGSRSSPATDRPTAPTTP